MPAAQYRRSSALRARHSRVDMADLDPFLDRVRVGTFLPGTLVKAAEFAVSDADVRVVEMAVDVVVRRQSMFWRRTVSASLPRALRSVVL